MDKQNFGIIGMAVMGRNLALNVESRGYSVAIYSNFENETKSLKKDFPEKSFYASYDIKNFVKSIEKPRRIMLMVKAGAVTDETIESLLTHLDEGDILIDGGNTNYIDTMRRSQRLNRSRIYFIGAGVSGGEEGALKGPSIMPGGPKEAYELVEPILKDIAAKAPSDGEPCVTYIGPNGAGHYVKMVHNGIEYGDMQLIAESYAIMKDYLDLSNEEIADVFLKWNEGELNSFLIELTANALRQKDPHTGHYMVDIILDKAGNKETGKWTSQSALDLGQPLPLITESVFARFTSTFKEERVKASKTLPKPKKLSFDGDKSELIEKLRQALYFTKIMSYAQGFSQMANASKEYNWDLQLGEIAKIFRAGCIIRARFLENITNAYGGNANLENLVLDDYFKDITERYQESVRDIVATAVKAGVPIPAFSSAIAYYDSYRSERLSANIIQAQRDYFGAHTYERVDKPGHFHFDWYGDEGEIKLN